MRTINVIDKHYCKRCPFERLHVAQEILYEEDKREVINTVKCANSELCANLWSRLVDVYEDEEETTKEQPQRFIDNDWSFTDDATEEDMQL